MGPEFGLGGRWRRNLAVEGSGLWSHTQACRRGRRPPFRAQVVEEPRAPQRRAASLPESPASLPAAHHLAPPARASPGSSFPL